MDYLQRFAYEYMINGIYNTTRKFYFFQSLQGEVEVGKNELGITYKNCILQLTYE